MEEQAQNNSGGGDIISSIANLAGSVMDFFTVSKQARYGRLPDWLSPADFQTRDRTADIILIGMFVILLAVIIAIIVSARSGAK